MTTQMKIQSPARLIENTRGLTLLVSLILLVVMSLVGVVAVNMAVQEGKIAVNFQDSMRDLTFAEGGIERARQVIMASPNPELPGYDCTSDDNTHYFPDGAQATETRARFCIELITVDIKGLSEGRGSGQDQGVKTITYTYKVDSAVVRENEVDSTQEIVLRQIQTLEQQTRFSI